MKRLTILSAVALMGSLSGAAIAQEVSIGAAEYKDNCASCHGTTGKGDGPFSEYLRNRAPSLTTFSKNNGGVFPVERIYKIIDGRTEKGHGSAEMPVWGKAYTAQSVETHGPFFGEFYAEEVVRARILALVAHIHSLQEK